MDKEEPTLQLKTLVETLTKRETQKLHLDCSGCETEGQYCNCTFLGILSENAFNIDLMITNKGSSSKWCPSTSVTSNFFECDESQSISSAMLCDAYRDCPNGVDEGLLMCNPEKLSYVMPVFALFLVALCLAIGLSTCEHPDCDNEESVEHVSSCVTHALKDLKDFLTDPIKQKEKRLVNSIQKMGLNAKVSLLKITYNLEMKGKNVSGQMMKTAVERVFALKSEETTLLILVKSSSMPTAFKTRVIDLLKMGIMTRIQNYVFEKIPHTGKVYISLIFNICKTSIRVLLFPTQDVKDLATISVMINFHNNVIQQRTSMIDNIPLNNFIGLLSAIYASAQCLRLMNASSTNLPIPIPRCFPFGFKCNPRCIPFFTEIFISIKKVKHIWKIFTLKLAIIQEFKRTEEGSPPTQIWQDIQMKSSCVNRLYNELESLDLKEKKIKIAAVLGDIFQGAVLLILLLRTDLRLRGILGFANLASRMNVDIKSSDASGEISIKLNLIFSSTDQGLLMLVITWNLISPSFRVRDYISGHKSGTLTPSGILLTLSLFFSLSMHIGIVSFLGHFSIFLIPLPLALLTFTILIAKSCIDPHFQKEPFRQKFTYSLLAAIFPVSSTRPTMEVEGGEDDDSERVCFVQEKDASSELTLLHILHFGTYLASTTIYTVLMLTNLAFVNAMGKVEGSSGLNSSLVIFVGCPVASLLSILARLLHTKTEPWSIIQRSTKRSCCSCCPPKLKGSFKTIRIEDTPNEETPAAEYRDVLDHLAERNNRM